MQPICAVCLQPNEGGNSMNRVGGAPVCDPCLLGAAADRVRSRGWDFTCHQYVIESRHQDAASYYSNATLLLPVKHRLEFRAHRMTLPLRLAGLFHPRVISGEQLFDREIWLTSPTPEMTRTVLKDEGVQTVLLQLLADNTWLTLSVGRIDVQNSGSQYVSESRFFSEMTVLAAHLERLEPQIAEVAARARNP